MHGQHGGPLASFHPAVAEWFRRRYPDGPTRAQAEGWAAIASGADTLIAAPTGSGKTLAAFLVAIDRCYRGLGSGDARHGTDVVYVSPLRALTVDVSENLRKPLAEIAEVANELGLEPPSVQVAVRNGDTPPSERSAMLRNRPEIVVTTPESLYLLLTSARGREMLSGVRTVIVDEIHALARDKRGSHLALSLERLDRLVCSTAAGTGASRPVRIGLSATQRPVSTIARLLVGAGAERSGEGGEPRCTVVDVGHQRRLEVAIELPDDELGAVSTLEQMASVLDRIAAHIAEHKTTLVFVNTRRMAERVAHQLADRLGEDAVQAHHGSLSMDRRLRVEARLRAGELARRGGHRLARARHRRRASGARLPAGLTAKHRHVLAARRASPAPRRRCASRSALPAHARRARRVHGTSHCAALGRAGRRAAAGVTPRRPRPADRRRVRRQRPRRVLRGRAVRAGATGRSLQHLERGGLRVGRRLGHRRRRDRPGTAGGSSSP